MPSSQEDPTTKILKAISNEVRLKILLTLRDHRQLRFSDLSNTLRITPEKLAFHLRQLTGVNLVHLSNENYCLTELGQRVLGYLEELFINLKTHETRSVLLANGVAMPLETYLSYLLNNVCKPGSKASVRRKVLFETLTLVEEKINLQLVPESLVKLFLLGSCIKNDCLKGHVGFRVMLKNEKAWLIEEPDTEIVADSGLYDPLASGILLFDVNWATGVKTLYFPTTTLNTLKILAKVNGLINGGVIRLDDKAEDVVIQALEVLSGIMKLTISVGVGEGLSRVLAKLTEKRGLSPRNTLLSVLIRDPSALSEENVKMLSRLINSGMPTVFVFEDKILTGDLFLVPLPETPGIIVGGASILLPILFKVKGSSVDPLDVMAEIHKGIEMLIEHLHRRSTNVVRMIGEVAQESPAHVFQLSYPGFEATLLQSQPTYLDAWGTHVYMQRVLEAARGFIEEMTRMSQEGGRDVINAYFSPNTHLYTVAKAWGTRFPSYISNFSPFVYSLHAKRDFSEILWLEEGLHSSQGLVSIPEVRVASVSPADLRIALRFMYSKGIRSFTLTKTNLYQCATCGEVSQLRITQCPRCYSSDIRGLERQTLFYEFQDNIDPLAIEALSSRPTFRKLEEILRLMQ
jgi:DNA-binding HxlR family transcriptional regulator